MQQIRIGTSPNTSVSSSNGQTSTVGGVNSNIQLIKTSDGNFIQIKNNAKIGSPNVLTTTSLQSTTAAGGSASVTSTGNGVNAQYVLKNGVGQRLLMGNTPPIKVGQASGPTTGAVKVPTTAVASTSAIKSAITVPGVPTGTPRTLTVAQAQKMGLLSSAKLKELVTQATAHKQAKAQAAAAAANESVITASNTVTTVSSPAVLSSTNRQIPTPVVSKTPVSAISSGVAQLPAKPKLMQGHQKILIQTAEGVQKHVVLPPHLYKLAQEGKIKAVSIAGKGIQYVRVNTPNTNKFATTSTATSASTTNVSMVRPPIVASTSGEQLANKSIATMSGNSQQVASIKMVSWSSKRWG